MNKWLIPLFLFILLSSSAFAVPNDENLLFTTPWSSSYCLTNNSSIHQWIYTNFSNITQWFTLSKSESCRFGCLNITGECTANPYDIKNLTIFIVMPFISFILFYFVSILKDEDWMIHFMLMSAAMFFLIIPMGIIAYALPGPYMGGYYFILILTVITVIYYVLKLIVRAFNLMGAK